MCPPCRRCAFLDGDDDNARGMEVSEGKRSGGGMAWTWKWQVLMDGCSSLTGRRAVKSGKWMRGARMEWLVGRALHMSGWRRLVESVALDAAHSSLS